MKLREYHAPRWNEPIIHELSSPGERGFIPPSSEKKIKERIGSGESLIPEEMKRKSKPDLPELSQAQVLQALPASQPDDSRHGDWTST